jgi:putative SOS response-associated peptidase YedK
MCSRFTVKRNEAAIKLREKILVYGAVPRADVRPTDYAPIIVPENGGYYLTEMRWGWHVPWDKTILINAKSETVTTLKSFKPYLENRCLLPVDGFYEKGVRFTQTGEPIFMIAGLWKKELDRHRFTMLTTTANETVHAYHHRMPFILPSEKSADWLGDDWLNVLATPNKAPLEKIQKQPDLFLT